MADLRELIHEAVAHALAQRQHSAPDSDILFILHEVLTKMSALSDAVALVQTDIAAVQTSANTAIAKIEAIPGAPSDAADVASAVTALGDAHTALNSISASLDAANPPAPAS